MQTPSSHKAMKSPVAKEELQVYLFPSIDGKPGMALRASSQKEAESLYHQQLAIHSQN